MERPDDKWSVKSRAQRLASILTDEKLKYCDCHCRFIFVTETLLYYRVIVAPRFHIAVSFMSSDYSSKTIFSVFLSIWRYRTCQPRLSIFSFLFLNGVLKFAILWPRSVYVAPPSSFCLFLVESCMSASVNTHYSDLDIIIVTR